MPELAGLADDLLAVGVAALPFYRGMEAVHETGFGGLMCC
jgi:hypothetical protein